MTRHGTVGHHGIDRHNAERADAPTGWEAVGGASGSAATAAAQAAEFSGEAALLAGAEPCCLALAFRDNAGIYVDGCGVVKAAPKFYFHITILRNEQNKRTRQQSP